MITQIATNFEVLFNQMTRWKDMKRFARQKLDSVPTYFPYVIDEKELEKLLIYPDYEWRVERPAESLDEVRIA